MNKSYKVIWNASLQDWVVTSEFASGKKKKSKTSSISGKLKGAAALITLIGSFAPFSIGYASDIAIPGFTPEKNSHLNGQIIVSSDDTLFNNGSMGFNSFQQGELSYKTSSIKDLAAAGKITSGNEYLDDNTLALGGKLKQISYIDAVTHTNKTTTVYDNDIIAERSISDSNTTTNISVGEGQYVNTNLATVLEGGKLTVKVGETDSDWINNPANNLNAIIKESSIFLAQTDDTSSTDAVINYDAKTRFYVGDAANNPTANNVSFNANNYQGQIKSKIGNWNVHDINSFKQYNAALISAIEGGKLSPEDYETQIALAYTSVKETIVIDPSQNIPDGDAALSSSEKETNSYIKGQGKRSVINISSDSVIVGQGQTSIVKVEDGATVNNDGRLAVGFNNSHGGYAVFAENGTLNNQGVIDAGYTDLDGKGELGRRQTGIRAAKSSLINNNGIVNVTGPDAYQAHTGISVVNTSEVVNNGVINVSVTRGAAIASADDDYGYGSFGIDQTAGTKAVNNGDIYLGRKAQYSLSDASENIDTFWRSVGVSVRGANAYFENGTEGNITVGDDAQNSIAILARKDSQGDPTVIQNGTITINGHYSGDAPLENIGILVDGGANDVTNSESGSITLNGTNGIGIKVLNTSQATNAGVLNVNGGADAASGTRNFGIWVEGVGSRATTTGLINLTGDGAIAIHARDGAVVNVNDAGTVNFVNGRNQTGYFVYGKGSTININNTMPQNLSTIDSTLYRIDGGATYSGNGAILTASGKGSTLLLATGKGSDIDTTGMILTASGDGATAVKVEGGAHAKIDATTNIDLTGVGATAGSVQGASTTIYGDTGATGDSVLDSYATLSSTGGVAAGALGYKVATGGTLNHHGIVTITAPDSTGVQINGGTMNNDAAITVDGTAVDIIGADSVVNNTGIITATDGKAGYRLSNGASLDLTGDGTTNADGTAHGILLDTGAAGLTVKDATINMAATGTGNGIENGAEIDGIQLTNTTINVGNGAGVRTSASLAQTNSGTININGAGTGLLFQNANGSASDKAYDMSKSQGLVINVNSAAGNGMTTNTSGAVKSGVSINVNDAAGGSALVVKGNSLSVAQSGTIQSASATQMVDINNGNTSTFTNSGTIASTAAGGVVMNVDQQAVNFTNETGGKLAGAVSLLNGNNSVTLEHGSQAASVFTTGAGDDNYRLTGITVGENAALFTTLDGGLGSDTLSLNKSVYTLSDAGKIQNIEHVNLANNSTFTLDKTQLDLSAADAGWNIDGSSTLAMNDDRALSFASHLAGSGLVTVDLGSKDNDFAFTANNAADGFAGTVALANSHFVLDGATTQNTLALSDATLKLGAGSVTDVAKGTQNIGGLAFDGGTIIFDTDTLGRSKSEAFIQTSKDLDIGGAGVVQLRTNDVLNAPTLPPDTLNILSQDDANPILKLAGTSGTVSGYGANLMLEKTDGSKISDPTYSHVMQNGLQVADATYDFGLTAGDASDGLYVNYGLQELDLLTSGADALALNAAGATGAGADLSARLTGSGDLAIEAGAGNTVSLSNMNNDYTGKTDVRTGTLLAESDNVLGNTRELHQAAGTRVDLNGHAQTVGLLNTDATATTDFNGGSLAVTHGGIVNGMLTGAGELAVNGGTLTVNGANAAMTAATTIADGAEVALNDISGIGAGDILDNGLLTLNEGVQGVLGNNLTGSGNLQKNGSGLVSLTTASARYTGTTDINGGGLQLGDSSTDVTLASSTVNVKEGASFGGYGGTAGDVNNAGTLTLGDISPRLMALRAGGEAQTFGIGQNLTNSGTINVSQPGSTTAGNILHVTGDYTGSGGTLNLNTQLGDDSSPTDKLVVDGSTHGTTTVAVSNVGGTGAATLNGIEVVSVGGTSDGEFSKKGRIVAGAYDYDLVKKGSNWYLTNNGATPVDPVDPVDPVVPDDGGDTPDNGGNTPAPNVRPEGKAYASNLAAANNMFNMTLHDRLGETHYVDAFTGEKKVTSLWLRQVGGHNRSSDGSGQNKTQANRYIAQLGGDIGQWSSNGDDRFHLGVMGGYASQNSNTRNHVTGYSADGSVHGYSAGLYGTWFQDNEEKTGAYVDTWALYNWFDNGVSSKGQSSESYKSRGITASVESGYTWKMGEKNDHESYYIQPQAQLTWMGVKANDHKEANGTDVQFTGDGNVQTRLGVRAFIKGHNAKLDDGKERTFEPFVEANWLHNTHDFGANLDGVSVKQVGARNVGELKVGVEAKLNKTVNLWGNVGQQMGDKGYSDTQATVGFKMNF